MPEEWITAQYMAEAAKKAKQNRKNKLSAFSRVKKRLETLLEGGSEESLLREVYSELAASYQVVEKSHEDYCLLLSEADADEEDTYLDGPSDTLSQMQLRVNRTVKEIDTREKTSNLEADRKKKVDSSIASFKASIQNFGKPSVTLQNLSVAKTC